MVVWLGIPFYWGWIHLSLWSPVIWSALLPTVGVAFNWRIAEHGLIATWILGLYLCASGAFPIYFLGRFLSVFTNLKVVMHSG